MHDLGRAVPDTCYREKEKCEAGVGGIMPKLLSKVAPCYKCYRVSCLVTIFQAIVLVLF